jgi:hypothetical protein
MNTEHEAAYQVAEKENSSGPCIDRGCMGDNCACLRRFINTYLAHRNTLIDLAELPADFEGLELDWNVGLSRWEVYAIWPGANPPTHRTVSVFGPTPAAAFRAACKVAKEQMA